MIALIDYDSGNLRSAHRALLKVGADVTVVRDGAGLREAHAVVLPGVGAFDDCVNALRRQELLGAVREAIQAGKPFFGICVGYQALFDRSEEFNSCAAGLGVFGGSVVRFTGGEGIKVPQIGWNRLHIARPDCPMLQGVAEGSFVYFVHSFYPRPTDSTIAATTTDYGETFTSAVWRDNVFATQFHPEKSQDVGLKLLENFVAFAKRN